MARIIPDGWRELASAASAAALPASAQRHRETLELFARGLPDDYTVYHAVHWTNVERGFSVFGEIDFVIVDRHGDLLLVEQKTGFLEEGADGLLKRERGRVRNVPVQIARTVSTLRDKLARRPGCESIRVDYLLYCPDYAVRRVESAGLSVDRLVDASRRDRLVPTIREILPARRPPPSGGHGPAWHQVDRFLRDVIELETDVNALVGQAQALVTRISGGLAHWARQLEFAPFRLHVDGTAGSGKTQLALAEHRDAIARGRRPLYVCYNRPLADHFAAVVPAGGEVCTFHTLCQRLLRDAGRSVDLSAPDGFERLEREAASVPIDARWSFDTVVVDEGQDFPVAWRDQVLRHAKPDARVIWLEDAMQALYQREPAPLPGWVTLHARANYRSPREVVRLLGALLPPGVEIEAAGPLAEAGLEIIEYTDAEGLLAGTKEAIRKCLGEGFRRHDIAVVSFRGREGSALLGLDHLGPHPIRRFTGRYDLLAQPVFTDGELLVESVYRFKGQAAPAVVLSEVDFETLDERTVRKLFVGATRATMKLAIVASARAARVLRKAVGG
ncbi:MAG TPA: ATP-binding domain-containing protein [Burkholderiaceae bacterium]|nr:ATP-binding domain-containing protein [Burkholderiaceae bacterium]